MNKPSSLSSRAEVLSFLRRTAPLVDLTTNDDHKLLLRAGIVPKSFLRSYCASSHIDYPTQFLDELTRPRWGSQKSSPKVLESSKYLRANPHNRTRPVASAYDSDPPYLPHGLNARYSTTYRISGRDRMLIWYATGNATATASKNESTGLWTILQFLRLPHVQRAWKRWKLSKGQPTFPLPEDAK